MSRPRKETKFDINGFFDRVEADYKDCPHDGYERDMFLNYLCNFGFSDSALLQWAERFKRSLKATKRQMQLVLYVKEQNSIVLTYKNRGYRTPREGWRWTAWDAEVARCHLKDGVPIERTAEILQRPVDELKRRFYRLEEKRPTIKTLGL